MGVPAFYRWLSEKYPKIIVDIVEKRNMVVDGVEIPVNLTEGNPNNIEFDNLFVDMNGLIHPCSHPEDREAPSTEEEMYLNVTKYIDRLFAAIRPRRLLFLAIDGVAPRAKMNQQRSRRFRAAQDAVDRQKMLQEVRIEMEALGLEAPPKKIGAEWDSNVITPGTEFMTKLSVYIWFYVLNQMNTNAAWKNIKVIVSDASEPGEGEHKIMSFIRSQRSQEGYDPNQHHVIHGLDADLIMLALATHEPHFTILREKVIFGKRNRDDPLVSDAQRLLNAQTNIDGAAISAIKPEDEWVYSKPLQGLHITILREYLEGEFKCLQFGLPFPYNFERIIDDFIFMCFFVGNDFLPHLPALDIRDGALDFLIHCYKEMLTSLGDYLTSPGGVVNLRQADVILARVGEVEDEVFRRRKEAEENEEKKRSYYKSRDEALNIAKRNQSSITESQAVLSNSVTINSIRPLSNAPTTPWGSHVSPNATNKVSSNITTDTTVVVNNQLANTSNDRRAIPSNHQFATNVTSTISTNDNITFNLQSNQLVAKKLRDSLLGKRNISSISNPVDNQIENNGLNSRIRFDDVPQNESVNTIGSDFEHAANSEEVTLDLHISKGQKINQDSINTIESVEVGNKEDSILLINEPIVTGELDIVLESDEVDVDVEEIEILPPELVSTLLSSELKPKEGESIGFNAKEELKRRIKDKESKIIDQYKKSVEDNIRLHEAGWKERYYNDKYKKEDIAQGGGLRHMCFTYVQGLCWVLKYYFEGCPSWNWYYPFHYAPMASDLVNIDKYKIEFELSTPFRPIEQLLAVLPAESVNALPEECQYLMTDPSRSPIIDIYQADAPLDPNGKALPWLWVLLLPFIDEKRITSTFNTCKDIMTLENRRRNAFGSSIMFIYCANELIAMNRDVKERKFVYQRGMEIDSEVIDALNKLKLLNDDVNINCSSITREVNNPDAHTSIDMIPQDNAESPLDSSLVRHNDSVAENVATIYFDCMVGRGVCGSLTNPVPLQYAPLHTSIPAPKKPVAAFQDILNNQIMCLTFIPPSTTSSLMSELLPGLELPAKVLDEYDLLPRRPRLSRGAFNMLNMLLQAPRQGQQAVNSHYGWGSIPQGGPRGYGPQANQYVGQNQSFHGDYNQRSQHSYARSFSNQDNRLPINIPGNVNKYSQQNQDYLQQLRVPLQVPSINSFFVPDPKSIISQQNRPQLSHPHSQHYSANSFTVPAPTQLYRPQPQQDLSKPPRFSFNPSNQSARGSQLGPRPSAIAPSVPGIVPVSLDSMRMQLAQVIHDRNAGINAPRLPPPSDPRRNSFRRS